MSSTEVSATFPIAGLGPDQAFDEHRRPRLFPRRDGMQQATGGPWRSPFPPIEDYAFLSDREVNALVAPSGNVEWMCVPRPDSPSVFGSMLDRAAGGFRLGTDDVMVPEGPPIPTRNDDPRDDLADPRAVDTRTIGPRARS